MHTKVYYSTQQLADIRAILLKSHHFRSKLNSKTNDQKNKPRKQAEFNSKSYHDALQRSFNRAKMQIYFNPDMQYFITLTYKGKNHTPEDVLHDVKMFIKREKRSGNNPKYIYVMEYQKRGSIHVHMIANKQFTMHKNQNGYQSLTYWTHGFSSVLTIKDFDNNFKPYLYLFKYMRKSQRIGKSFVHSSRNLNSFKEFDYTDLEDYSQWTTVHQERTLAVIDENTKLSVYRYFLKRDTIPITTLTHKEKNYAKLHSNY